MSGSDLGTPFSAAATACPGPAPWAGPAGSSASARSTCQGCKAHQRSPLAPRPLPSITPGCSEHCCLSHLPESWLTAPPPSARRPLLAATVCGTASKHFSLALKTQQTGVGSRHFLHIPGTPVTLDLLLFPERARLVHGSALCKNASLPLKYPQLPLFLHRVCVCVCVSVCLCVREGVGSKPCFGARSILILLPAQPRL